MVWIQTQLIIQAYSRYEESFDRNVHVAMQNVVNRLLAENIESSFGEEPPPPEIQEIDTGHLIVQVRQEVDDLQDDIESLQEDLHQLKRDIKKDIDEIFYTEERSWVVNPKNENITVRIKAFNDSMINTDNGVASSIIYQILGDIDDEDCCNWIDCYNFDESIAEQLTELELPNSFEYAVTDGMGEFIKSSEGFHNSGKIYEKDLFPGKKITDTGSLLLKVESRNFSIFSKLLTSIISSAALLMLASGLFIYLFGLYRKQKEVSEARDDFINSMSHELKTPLATIALSLENMDVQSEKNSNYAAIIKEENVRMQHYVDNILQLARLDKTEFEIKPYKVDICTLVRDVVDKEQLNAQEKNGVILCNLPESLTVNLDVMHMRNVLHNLIDNALKYNDRKPLIEVDLVKKGSHVKITITDNGRGISKEHQQKIFDKFYRVSKGNLYSVKGTGIGLSYAKQVVELHNGKIDVRSVVNEGSTFTISLPCE